VTLRARLTAAFLAVVLGPVLLGAVFVGITVATVGRSRSLERLDLAVAAVQTALDAQCQRLRAAAELAGVAGGAQVNAEVATGVRLMRGDGALLYNSPGLPPEPWADCAGTQPGGHAICARVELRDRQGRLIGYADAVRLLDLPFVRRLAQAAGAAVTIPSAELSTERSADLADVGAAASRIHGTAAEPTEGGRFVRLLPAGPGVPLPVVLSVRRDDPERLYAVLVGVVVLTGLLSVVAAWWLARSTTRPLTELTRTVEQVAAGDLAARVPIRSQDEVGRLGATFNRMAHETQGYVQALTASRDQLRGHLGLLGDTLSSTHDLDRILQVILQTALAVTGAQAGVLLLVDPAAGELVGQCGEGLAERGTGDEALLAADLRVPLGEGLLGRVAATGEACRGRAVWAGSGAGGAAFAGSGAGGAVVAGSGAGGAVVAGSGAGGAAFAGSGAGAERDASLLSPAEPRCRTYVAVPFAAFGDAPETDADPPAARGVLALYDRHGFDEFDDADLVTLRTFAGQAAVALDNVRVHEEAQRLSLTDPLTGLSNYRFLKESIRREVERASRFGRRLAVLALDLDRFKEVNDTYGHAAGDAVLAEFARRLRAEVREVDFAFRQGGEEFVILLPETDLAGGIVVAERLGEAVRRSPVLVASAHSDEPMRIPMTVSIGIAVYPDHGTTGSSVLEAADNALYAAKTGGRDQYRLAFTYPPPGRHRLPGGYEDVSVAAGGTQPPRQSRGG
jgi:diguanylate cyclase (GGDEF)-like protein